MSSTQELLKMIGLLFGIVALAFGVHVLVLHFMAEPLWANQIAKSYLVNAALAAVILAAIVKAPAKFKNSLGFMFMGGSFLKFVVFFLVFYPAYNADGEIDNFEFSTFFIPYALCLILETTLLINKLNRMD